MAKFKSARPMPTKLHPKPPETSKVMELARRLASADTNAFTPCVTVDVDEWTAFKWVVEHTNQGAAQPGEDLAGDLLHALERLVLVIDHSHAQAVETIPKSLWDEVRSGLLRCEQGDA